MIEKLAEGYVEEWRGMEGVSRFRFALRLKEFGQESRDEFAAAARLAYRKILSELSGPSHTGVGKWAW